MNLYSKANINKGPIANKVGEITILFWIIKLLTTGMGEAFSDFLITLSMYFSGFNITSKEDVGNIPESAMPIILATMALLFSMVIILFVVTMKIQLSADRYVPWKYWLNVLLIAIIFTAIADFTPIGLVASTLLYFVIMTVIFILWYRSEKTLSFHDITTKRRELFYWVTVMATFAMGTALGDMTATTLNLGFLASGLIFTGMILLTAITYKLFNANEIVCFWFAYILARPLGASFSDWMSDTSSGLGLGKGYVSLVLAIIIFVLVAYLQIKYNKKVKESTLIMQ